MRNCDPLDSVSLPRSQSLMDEKFWHYFSQGISRSRDALASRVSILALTYYSLLCLSKPLYNTWMTIAIALLCQCSKVLTCIAVLLYCCIGVYSLLSVYCCIGALVCQTCIGIALNGAVKCTKPERHQNADVS